MSDTRIQMRSGRMVDPFALRTDDIELDDFAWGLAHTPGFKCMTTRPYYNAQHACAVAELVPSRLRLAALHHDDAEVITGDWPTPMKQRLPELMALEESIMRVVAERWKFDYADLSDPQLKAADKFCRGVEGWFLKHQPKWAAARFGASLEVLDGVTSVEDYPYMNTEIDVWSPERAFKKYKAAHVRYTVEAQS